MLRTLRFLALVVFSLSIAACSSSEPEEEEVGEQPPAFSISSVQGTLSDGSAGLAFFATPNTEVKLIRVDVSNPVGGRVTFDPQGVVVLGGEVTPLQAGGTGYTRVSGNWSFRFVGERAAGSRATFDVTVPLSVAAVQEEIPEVEIFN